MEQDLNALADSAKTLYDNGSYESALEIYGVLEQQQVKQSELFHNMGNAWARLGEWGEARLYFERALLYDPKNADAAHNLNWVKMRLTDELVEPRQELIEYLSDVLRGIAGYQSWAVAGWVVLALTVGLLVYRKWFNPGFSWRFAFTTTVLAGSLLLSSWIALPKSRIAVVVADNTYGYSEPHAQDRRTILLSEGTAGRLIRTRDQWYYIELGNGQTAWFSQKEWEHVLPYELD